MAIQSQGIRTVNTVPGAASYGIYPPSTVRPALLEMGAILAGTANLQIGLGRPVAAGTTSGPVLFQQDDPGDPAAVVNGHITWLVPPTAPAIYHRRWNGQSTIGAGVFWSFPRGLVIPGGGALLLVAILNVVAIDVTATVDA